MLDFILDIFRRRKLRKFASDIPTGFVPVDKIYVVNVVIDVEDPEFEGLRKDISAWGRQRGIKVNMYFLDFRKLGKEDQPLTDLQATITRKDLDWLGTPDLAKAGPLVSEPADLLISMIDNGHFPIEFISRCAKARFKIGRCGFEGHPYDMVITGKPSSEGVTSGARMVFTAITEFLNKVR